MWDYIYIMGDKGRMGVREDFRICFKEECKYMRLSC